MGWQDAPEVSKSPAWASAPEVGADKPSGGVLQQVGNLVAGAVRGAGSIGATLLRPVNQWDENGNKIDGAAEDAQRRAAMDSGLKSMGAEPSSIAYKGGKIGTEIAGTLGVGGALANGARALGASAPVINALSSAGMTTGATGGNALANLALRSGAGAAVGGASSGLVDPSQALEGAVVGGAMPGVLQAAGKAGSAIAGMVRGPAQPADLTAAINAARNAGYVIPPTQARPSLANRLLEGFSGKITTAQNASAKNGAVTAELAASGLGLPAGTKITPDVLTTVRKNAGQAYDAVSTSGVIQPGAAYEAALDKITAQAKLAAAGFPNAKPSPIIAEIESLKSPAFDASSAVSKIKELRAAADAAYASGEKESGKALKAASAALEDVIDSHLQAIGAPADLLQGFRDARQLIAKTYTVEKALNPTTGAIDARKIGAQIVKGKPVSGDLRTIGEFANRFPKAAQTIEGMGSLPQTSPLDWAAGGAISAATSNPLALAAVLGRPAARAAALSPIVQNRLASSANPNALQSLLANPELQKLILRGAPVAFSDR